MDTPADLKEAVNFILKSSNDYIRHKNYLGHDPYDGLNSKFFRSSPFYKSEFLRLCWIQFFKLSPINLRPCLGVEKGFNPKAGALFLSGYIQLAAAHPAEHQTQCHDLFIRLKSSLIRRSKGIAWGYNFDWQAKAFYVPIGTPNVVTSVYVGHALLDYAQHFSNREALSLAFEIKDFILNELVLWEKDDSACFGYIPGEKAEVHNANLMTAAFLARLYFLKPDQSTRSLIEKAVRFSTGDIASNGYWPYGTMAHHRWMDNFHTGFNLEALLMVREYLLTDHFDEVIRKVYTYYRQHFFLNEGIPKYYNTKVYPIDIHTIAESILCLAKVGSDASGLFTSDIKQDAQQLAQNVERYGFTHFWDKQGYFYYQKHKFYFNRINYIRWSQAWMFYALAFYQSKFKG